MSQTLFWTFAAILSTLTCAAIVVPYLWFRRASDAQHERRRLTAAIAATISLPAFALGIYSLLGSPQLISVTVPQPAHPGVTAAGPGGQAGGDLQQAVDRLERRLAESPNDEAGWRLLAQSYAFAGRDADADAAQAQADAIAGGQAPAIGTLAARDGATDVAALQDQTQRNPKDARAWAQLAEAQRRARSFDAAIDAYRKLVALKGMNADLWADYADATAASRGGLDAQSKPMIQEALKLEPEHVKGLWLLGSLKVAEGDAAGALAVWQRLGRLLPPDSSDARIIEANIEEARARIGTAPRAITVRADGASSSAGVSISGEVVLDQKFAARVPKNAVLFVVARANNQPGPPLAATRQVVSGWPVRFVLDESNAMIAGRTIADFDAIIIEARISQSGTAETRAGDLRGRSESFNPRAAKPLRLVINEEVG